MPAIERRLVLLLACDSLSLSLSRLCVYAVYVLSKSGAPACPSHRPFHYDTLILQRYIGPLLI